MNFMKRLLVEDDGIEMVEWAILGGVFAVAGATALAATATDLGATLDAVEAVM